MRIDLLGDLRAIIFYKNAERTKLRPIGIGETLRRLVCRCVAQQDKQAWNTFFTHLLPEDEEARNAAIEEAEAAVASTTSSWRAAVDSAASTQRICRLVALIAVL